MMIGIYRIISPSNKIYVGQSTNIKRRRWFYNVAACENQRHIYNSIKKYGFEKHVFEIIELCSEEILTEREQHWIDFHIAKKDILLNICLIAKSVKGIKWTEESKQRQRLNRQYKPLSEDHKKNISSAMMGRIGTVQTQEMKDHQSFVMKGRKAKPEHVEKRVAKLRGKPLSEEHRKLLSIRAQQRELNKLLK